MKLLKREEIISALDALNGKLALHDQHAQIYVVGGAVMCLVHQARPATKDVDAWFTEPTAVRRAARQVAEDMGLPEDWLNDAAKAFVPEQAGFELWQTFSHLDLLMADMRTLLAMKCAAARTTEDASDIRFLTEKLGLTSADEVLDMVLSYYPANQLPVRVRLLLEEMFE